MTHRKLSRPYNTLSSIYEYNFKPPIFQGSLLILGLFPRLFSSVFSNLGLQASGQDSNPGSRREIIRKSFFLNALGYGIKGSVKRGNQPNPQILSFVSRAQRSSD